MPILKNKIEYFFIRLLISFLRFLNNKQIYKIFLFLGKVIYKLSKRRRELTLKNLHLIFKEKNKEEIEKLSKKIYESVAITLAETILILLNKIEISEMIVNESETIKKLKKISKSSRNGILFITAHFGNWELLAHFIAKSGYPMTGIGRKGNNTLIEENLTTPFREKFGNINVYKENAIMKIVKTLKQNRYAGFLIDQKSSGTNSLRVNFFGYPADTTNSVAIIKTKFDPIILPIFCARQSDGRYKIIVLDPCEFIGDKFQMTQKYNDILEEVIKEYPEQWFWMHNRWRLPK